ncbi:LOW QUALITY PROTEIN: polygalacturonase-like [Lolium rigidum]|uniref:LOW QUALITY PROTEIN: polygalacturonase-like n=1 Tax=Lolium rigidum TaxID=89674 RepID=UPI001F5D53F0|nr:LOW QUALITY PROTEIN: polygalacturonase-like [Lolium rigidum]
MASSTSAKLVWSPLLALLLMSVCDASSVEQPWQRGARGDGKHDDTQALAKAWSAACSSSRPVVLLVPKGKSYLTKSTTLSGPCKSTVVCTVKGTMVAPPSRSDWTENNIHWIMFQGISGLTVTVGGTINGNGQIWWKNSCKTNEALPCTQAPTALTFHLCDNLKVDNLKIVHSQQIHMSIEDCTDVQLTRMSITAPSTSPNTDGIHITRSKDVQVRGCIIKTGDDCMSIEDGTQNLHVTKVVCGPGHGISIGSLGDDNSRAEVSGITIDSVQLYGTTNGARIKTWQGGSGFAKNIIFQNIIMDNVQNPIIIDQNYCDSAKPCKDQESAVEISNIVFENIRGTTTSEDAIKLSCNKNAPCSGITLENIELKLESGNGDTESTCQNAKWTESGNVVPSPCKGNN